jgi:hypothetical protein
VSGKNNKILPIPETMQGLSTSTESKGRKEQKKKNKKKKPIMVFIGIRGFQFESFFKCSINKVHIQNFRLGLG